MKHCVRALIGLLTITAAVAHLTARQSRPFAPLALDVSTQARSLKQGEVILVGVTASRDVATLEGSAFGHPVEFWRATSPRRWLALVGIPLDVQSGPQDIVI